MKDPSQLNIYFRYFITSLLKLGTKAITAIPKAVSNTIIAATARPPESSM